MRGSAKDQRFTATVTAATRGRILIPVPFRPSPSRAPSLRRCRLVATLSARRQGLRPRCRAGAGDGFRPAATAALAVFFLSHLSAFTDATATVAPTWIPEETPGVGQAKGLTVMGRQGIQTGSANNTTSVSPFRR